MVILSYVGLILNELLESFQICITDVVNFQAHPHSRLFIKINKTVYMKNCV